MRDAWQILVRRPEVVLDRTLEHLQMVGIACGIAIVIGVPLGIFISGKGKRRQAIADTVLYVAEIAMTVPSIALFGFVMAILSSLNLPSLGLPPAIIALVIYAQLPILRNTYTAIRGVDPAIIESGRGMGMSESQLLFKVKLPLAIPVIMAGLRTSVVATIAIAAIAALIGAGGLGWFIRWGLRQYRMDLIIVGSVSVAIIGILFDVLMHRVERWVTPKGLKRSVRQ
ncbi:MAG: ABC transporter permease [Dehalococcoidia bacterium]|nr:ABC transporter permease [Dehalococcoidia bacterium]